MMDGSGGAIADHLIGGGAIVYGVEWLKAQPWCPWITADSKTINRWVSAGAAVAVTTGFTLTGSAADGWSLTIPPLAALGASAWQAVGQWLLQQVIYDGIVQKRGAAKVGA